METDRIDERI